MNPWSVFWRQGHSTTFGDYFKHGYDGAVANWWNGHVEALEAGSTVLEVGCGNCSLLPFLVRAGSGGRYIGVDLAAIEISEAAGKGLDESGIEFDAFTGTSHHRNPYHRELAHGEMVGPVQGRAMHRIGG